MKWNDQEPVGHDDWDWSRTGFDVPMAQTAHVQHHPV